MVLIKVNRMYKFGIFVALFGMTLISSQVFGYLEDKVYCNFDNKNVTIFLKDGEGTVKCKTYLDTIYQLALAKYNEISSIRTYIDQGDDIYYWKEVLEQKKTEFLQLVNYRTQIKKAIDKFEGALFVKYRDILQKPMQNYYFDLETQYYILVNQGIDLSKNSLKIAEIEQQMWNISHILNAENLDDIMEVVSSYIYLKKQIEGK